jgi:hypothetical protein
MLAANGTPSMETAPYVADCRKLWEEYGESVLPTDGAFEIGPIASVDVTNDLASLRQVLASNRALAYGTRLYTDWVSYKGDPVPYVGNGIIKKNKDLKPAGHCMLIRARRKPLKPLCAGMPGESGWTCGDDTRVLPPHFAREAAGAAGTRHSPRPLIFRGPGRSQPNSRACAARSRSCVCERRLLFES